MLVSILSWEKPRRSLILESWNLLASLNLKDDLGGEFITVCSNLLWVYDTIMNVLGHIWRCFLPYPASSPPAQTTVLIYYFLPLTLTRVDNEKSNAKGKLNSNCSLSSKLYFYTVRINYTSIRKKKNKRLNLTKKKKTNYISIAKALNAFYHNCLFNCNLLYLLSL